MSDCSTPRWLIMNAAVGALALGVCSCSEAWIPYKYAPLRESRAVLFSRGVNPQDLDLAAFGTGGLPHHLIRETSSQAAAGAQHDLKDSVTLKVMDNPGASGKEVSRTLFAESGITFLHITDAQIRDQKVYNDIYTNKLRWLDTILDILRQENLLKSSIRPILVERWDQLRLAAMIWGAAECKIPYVIHTGDLLDISLWSELHEGLAALTSDFEDTHVYSTPGNHDGSCYGNFNPEKMPKEQVKALFVNPNEFVLGHLAETSDGLGFTKNDYYMHCEKVVGHFGEDKPPPVQEFGRRWLREALKPKKPEPGSQNASDLEWIGAYQNWMLEFLDLNPAQMSAFDPEAGQDDDQWVVILDKWEKKLKNLGLQSGIPPSSLLEICRKRLSSGPTDRRPAHAGDCVYDCGEALRTSIEPHLPLGYYTFQMRTDEDFRIKAIVLDTRHVPTASRRFGEKGSIDWAQLSWLYEELVEADENRVPVLIFAHHDPLTQFHGRGHGKDLLGLLDTFKGCIIGYFYGHADPGEYRYSDGDDEEDKANPGYWFIRTPSLADFPQAGRLVRIVLKIEDKVPCEARIEYFFVNAGVKKGRDDTPMGRALASAFVESSDAAAYDEYMGKEAGKQHEKRHEVLREDCFRRWVKEMPFEEKYTPKNGKTQAKPDQANPDTSIPPQPGAGNCAGLKPHGSRAVTLSFMEESSRPTAKDIFKRVLKKEINPSRLAWGLMPLLPE